MNVYIYIFFYLPLLYNIYVFLDYFALLMSFITADTFVDKRFEVVQSIIFTPETILFGPVLKIFGMVGIGYQVLGTTQEIEVRQKLTVG